MGTTRIGAILAGRAAAGLARPPARPWRHRRPRPTGALPGLAAMLVLSGALLLLPGIAAAAPEPEHGIQLATAATIPRPTTAPDGNAAGDRHPAAAPSSAGLPSAATSSPLETRLDQWPAWRLPAPLVRPGPQAPRWPAWFAGEWQVDSTTLGTDEEPEQPAPAWRARFAADGRGGAVADRAFNALSAGRSLLGEALLSVEDDPADPRRQLARLNGERFLETTLIGVRDESPAADLFLNDELSLLVMHGARGTPTSRIETLGRWRRLPDGSIAGDQWQARYASPADGLRAIPLGTERFRLRLVPVPPGSDPAS